MAKVHARVLKKAASVVGGVDNLATALGVEPNDLASWMQDHTAPPSHVFLKALDIVAGGPFFKGNPGDDAA